MATSHWTILIFFPMAWSFVCPTEILAFSAACPTFTALGATILFASCDSEHVLKAWTNTDADAGGLGQIAIPLLSDRSHRLARDYGVLIEEEGVAQRALFFIDPLGVIRGSTVNDANVGRSVDETKRLLAALKFTDEFGEGCPVDWKSGQLGVKMEWSDVELEQPEVLGPAMLAASSAPLSAGSGLAASRPAMNRTASWGAGWSKAASIRPKTWGSGGGSGRTSTTPTEGTGGVAGRPRSLLWANNEEAVGVNGEVGV